MKNIPKVSCVVIGYNIQDYISKCLNSAISQDYPNYEIIFVDDGSTDDTYKIAQGFPGVTCFTKENGGIISARSYGVERATGDYIMFVDGDDYINENMISQLVSELEEGVDILFSDQWNEDAEGKFHIESSEANSGFYSGTDYVKLICTDQMLHFMFPKLYRKQFIVDAGYLNYPRITTGEDLLTNTFFGLADARVKYISQTNYYYRFNASSVTRKENPGILQQIKTIEIIEEHFKKDQKWAEFSDYIEYLYYSYVMYYLQFPFSNSLKKQIVDEIWPHLKNISRNKVYNDNKHKKSIAARILFYSYCYLEPIAFIPNGIIMKVRCIKKKIRWYYATRLLD